MAPQVYDYFFHQASPQEIHQEFTQSILFLLYLQMRLILLAIYWAHLILEIVLTFPYEFWHGLSFWSRIYYRLYNKSSKGRSIWEINVILKIDRQPRSSSRTCPLQVKSALFGLNFWCFPVIKFMAHSPTCISTTMKRSQILLPTWWVHLNQKSGTPCALRFPINTCQHCYSSPLTVGWAGGSRWQQQFQFT
jgi:hypothetical protein